MGKKKSSSAAASTSSRSRSQLAPSVTLREESGGKKQSNVNAKSMLKLDHFKSIASWASVKASIPSLGAVFGHRLASSAEALGVPPDPSLFSCQRCESILQPGYNCTVRIEKIKAKVRRRRKIPNFSTQNSVVYHCHFCSHPNLKRGTPKGYMKELYPPKAILPSKSDLTKSTTQKYTEEKVISATKDSPTLKKDGIASQEITSNDPVNSSPTTPSTKVATLLDMRKRKRNRSGSKKTAESESNSVATTDAETATITSSKRKRKSWTCLKDIAEQSEQNNSRNLTNLSIPFQI